jgi:hypothetical protein
VKTFPPKPKHCVICETLFSPRASFATCCSQRCAVKKVKADKAAAAVALKARKAALKRIPDLIKEAQIEFNAYIRARDKDKPCICCGQHLSTGEVGGAFDCGHYRSVGSASHLRYDERNAHGQRKQCNRWGAGRAVDYRVGLIARIGREAVEALEADNTPHKWERDELIAIRETYRLKRKELEKQQA